MRARITAIHYSDAYFSDRDELIGEVGQVYGIQMVGAGWYQFDFKPDHLQTPIFLACANFEVLR